MQRRPADDPAHYDASDHFRAAISGLRQLPRKKLKPGDFGLAGCRPLIRNGLVGGVEQLGWTFAVHG